MANIAIIIIPQFDPNRGGVQRSTSKLGVIFTEMGHKVIIISLASGEDGKHQNIPYFHIQEKVKTKEKLSQLFIKHESDIAINQMGYSTSLTRLIRNCAGKKVKLINTLRINPLNFVQNAPIFIEEYLRKKNVRWLNPSLLAKPVLLYHKIKQYFNHLYILNQADAYVMLSDGFYKELKYFGINIEKHKKKLFAIPNPFEMPELDPSSLIKENIILFVGRLNKSQKRVDLLMEIWKKLHSQLSDWEFWVVGDGPEKEWMEDFCFRNNMNRVKFFGFDQPDKYYRKAKILHFTSAFEGFGNVLIESQSYGVVPVLFNSYSAASDIVKDQKNGLLVNPFSTDEFAHKTMNLALDEDHWYRLAENSVINVERFNYHEIGRKWKHIFKMIR